jgi:polysaccharide lyase-like protein
MCDGFESVAAGASPTSALWQVIADYSEQDSSPNVQVSSMNAHTGTQAVRVISSGSRNGIVAQLPQTRYFVRAWFQVDSAPLGPAFIGLGMDQNSETRLRLQGQSFATINTVGPGDAVHPGEANGGNCAGCVTIRPNQWFCAEMFIDEAARAATLWIDGTEAASIVNGDGGWPVQPASPSMFIGSMGLQGGQTGVWIDDVAAGPERIGCD